MGDGTPWFFALFPVIHLFVGLYLGYYTLCLFLNKTYIHFYQDELNIVHQPLPWVGGNKQLSRAEINQLFVKEKVSHSDNGPRFKYQLMAKLRNGEHKKLLSLDHLSSNSVKKIEHRLEHYMGIPDLVVYGEYQPNPGDQLKQRERPQQRSHQGIPFNNLTFQSLFLAKVGTTIIYKEEPLSIAAISQYDWLDGNSDKLLQCFTQLNTELYLYLTQRGAILEVYQVRQLNEQQGPSESFEATRPVKSMSLAGKSYNLDRSVMGKSYTTFTNGTMEIKQWIYLSGDRQSMGRVINQQGQISYYEGHIIQDYHFEGPLDLNQIEQRKKPSSAQIRRMMVSSELLLLYAYFQGTLGDR